MNKTIIVLIIAASFVSMLCNAEAGSEGLKGKT